jgi:hypothetical protein
MAAFLVAYDLRRPGCQYDDFLAQLEDFPSTCHGLDAGCFVATDGTADEVRNALTPHLHPGDGLIVTAITPDDASWTGLQPEVRRWIHTHLS